MLNARAKEYGIDGIFAAIEKIKNSSFLHGENERGWAITLDWFILPNNFPKVLEGNYDDRAHKSGSSSYQGKVPYGSAGQGPLGEMEQEALARMLEQEKEGEAT